VICNTQIYQMARLNELTAAGGAHYDCILLAGGSDARAYEVLRNATGSGVSFGKVLLFDFEERRNADDPGVRTAYLRYMGNHSAITLLPCSIKDPSGAIKAMQSSSLSFHGSSAIAVDISCFTRPYFFSLLKYLQDHCRLPKLDVFYTEPMSYILPRGLMSYRASLGSLFVTEVPGFPGFSTGRKRSILVFTLGFDGELSVFISEEITPDSIIIVNGFPAYSPKFKDISLINNERLLNASDAKENIAYCCASNPYDLFNFLVALRQKHPDAFFNIAPLGPKPMALGACMFALADSSIRVVYPMPEKYANVSTDQCWHSWRYTVPLGPELAGKCQLHSSPEDLARDPGFKHRLRRRMV
jgi:hypothetical protein